MGEDRIKAVDRGGGEWERSRGRKGRCRRVSKKGVWERKRKRKDGREMGGDAVEVTREMGRLEAGRRGETWGKVQGEGREG